MKKSLSILIITTLLISIFISCSKDDNTSNDLPIKNYTAAIKGKNWFGELTYTGKPIEYYSVVFNADNTLVWSQLSGDYTGNWIVNEKLLTMTFTGNTAEIKATISDDDKLINISDNTGYYEIKSGQLILNPNIPLDNTIWKGTVDPYTLQLSFMPSNVVEMKIGSTTYAPYSYQKSTSGGAIRIRSSATQETFGVITGSAEMKGSHKVNDFPWKATKQ